MYRILLVDDHKIMADGLSAILSTQPNFVIVGVVKDGVEVMEFLINMEVDLILMDIEMRDQDGIKTTKQVKQKFPHIKVIILTSHDQPAIVTSAFKNSADGYILKHAPKEELILGIETVLSGTQYISEDIRDSLIFPTPKNKGYIPQLTRREKEILALIAEGLTSQEIADKVFLSFNTVETHRKHLLSKLDAKNSVGLVHMAIQKGLL